MDTVLVVILLITVFLIGGLTGAGIMCGIFMHNKRKTDLAVLKQEIKELKEKKEE